MHTSENYEVIGKNKINNGASPKQKCEQASQSARVLMTFINPQNPCSSDYTINHGDALLDSLYIYGQEVI